MFLAMLIALSFVFNQTIIFYLMGKPDHGHQHHQHIEHHDHHDHHDQHSSQLRHDKPLIFEGKSSTLPNDPLNFTQKHPLFNLELQKKGPEFSEIDDLRQEYIQKFAGKVPYVEIQVPKNIPGLVPKIGDLPSNRKLWRPTTAFERNGKFILHTHHFNTRTAIPFFFSFLLYGWWGHSTFAWYKMKYEDNDQWLGNFYDKLNTRFPPPTKLWLRPG